jgi:glycosyltransferase involved in cell wall biosynthesis
VATSVLMTTEGTYPYFKGGVSTWCDQLIRHMPHVDYHVFAVVPSPKQPLSFDLPGNVKSCRPFPLWGTELPGRQEAQFSKTYARRLRTTDELVEERFAKPFAVVVRSLIEPDADPEPLARALLELQDYFELYDYAKTMTSPEAWSIFLTGCASCLARAERPNLEEATTCMRWLLRYLSVLAVSYPETDIVHASMAGLAGVPGTLSKLRYRSAFLLTEHGIYLRELYLSLSRMPYSYRCRRFLHGLNGALVRMNYHYADCVTSLGEFNRRWQIRIGADPEKILFVPNGVDSRIFQPREGKRPAQVTVVTLARIYRLKGIDSLLRAAAIVHKRVPEVKFLILGEVADRRYYESCLRIVAENGLENVVEWGETSTPAEAYNAAHVFVLPSISEGMPYSVLEAMLSGCPVVASDVGNVADVLSGTGVLARPKDPEDLARALLHLLDGPDAESRREHLAKRALARARDEYSLGKCIARFDQLYEVLRTCAATYQPA